MKQAYMIVDIGTGNSRIAVLSEEGAVLALVRENSKVRTDARFDDAQYFEPAEWAAGIRRMAKQALAQAGPVSVAAVSASSQREGVVLIGRDGEPVVGYTNSDRRGKPFLGELDWARIWELTGMNPSALYSATKILGTMRYEPEILERTAFYTSISDWVGHLFTGVGVWERAQAMHSGVYDPLAADWSAELCALYGVQKEKLPPLADAGTVLGKVKPALCSELGLGEDCVFVTGTADTQAAITGTGAEPGETLIVSGTTSPSVKVMDAFRKYPLSWTSPTAEPGRFMFEVNTAASGVNLQRYKDVMLPDLPFAELDRDTAERGLPEAGLPPLLAVFLTGMHLDKDSPNGGFVMRNPVSIDLKPVHFLQAMELNIGMGITLCIQRIRELDGLDRDYLIGCGGGFTSPIIGRTVADLTGLPIRVYDSFREATVHGCFVLCREALGRPAPPRTLLREIEPRRSEELAAYFAQWKAAREQFREINF